MVDPEDLFKDKSIKSKAKTEILSGWIIDGQISVKELLEFAEGSKDPVKATCIEGLEFATKQHPAIANKEVFQFVTNALKDKAPRVKWESAKVIGNIASSYVEDLDKSIANLLANSTHEGTVVRWSSAFALGEILKLKTRHNKKLLPAIEGIVEKEEQNSIKKIYLDAIKKTTK
jgi:HEAT repeat protein